MEWDNQEWTERKESQKGHKQRLMQMCASAKFEVKYFKGMIIYWCEVILLISNSEKLIHTPLYLITWFMYQFGGEGESELLFCWNFVKMFW